MEEIRLLTKKVGFWKMNEILLNQKEYTMNLTDFFKALGNNSYYNSFFRVKEYLIDNNIIFIEGKNRKRKVGLTTKGLMIGIKLKELNEMIEKNE